MRFIDKTGCQSPFEKGKDSNIHRLGALSETACRAAERNGLGLLKTREGAYRIIKASGLGAYEDFLSTLKEVDDFLKPLARHEATRYRAKGAERLLSAVCERQVCSPGCSI